MLQSQSVRPVVVIVAAATVVEVIIDASFRKSYIGLLNRLITQIDTKISDYDEMLIMTDKNPSFESFVTEKRNESLLNKHQLQLQIQSVKRVKEGDPFLLTTLDGLQPLAEGQNILDIISPALVTVKNGVIESIHS